jgi:hypothetical protein
MSSLFSPFSTAPPAFFPPILPGITYQDRRLRICHWPSAAKVYSLNDVDEQMKAANFVLNGTHEGAQAFFQSHPEFKVCKDTDSFSVAVVRNKKADPKTDDIFILANYKDGKTSGMEVGPRQFSANNLESYCK